MKILRGATAVACVAMALSGCGGGGGKSKQPSKPQTPKTLAAWSDQFTKAVASGDCKKFMVVVNFVKCDANLLKRDLHGVRVVRTKSFGTGAVADLTGMHYPKQPADTGQWILIQDTTGGWIGVQDVNGEPPEVGTEPPSSVKPFASVASGWTDAVGRGDCKTAYKLAAVNEPPAVFCKNIVSPKAQQREVFAANPSARGTSLGGTANIQFFRYTVKVPKAINASEHWSYATLPVIHVSKQAQPNATNPYLAVQPIPNLTPAPVRSSAYTDAVKATYVKNCTAGGESQALCSCQIDTIDKAVPFSDFKTPTARFDKVLPGVKRLCNTAAKTTGSQDEKDVTRVALGGDLVPGFICSRDVSTDKVVPQLDGSREKCSKDLGNAPPDNKIKLSNVTVKGDTASVKGTDKQGHFTVQLVRGGSRWMIDGFANKG